MEMDSLPVEQMEEGLDLRRYFSLFWHWAWLIVLVTVIAGTASYIYSNRLTRFYRSSTTVMVNVAPASRVNDYSSIYLSQQLTGTYSQLMLSDPVIAKVAVQAGLPNSTGEIKGWITASPVSDTELIRISVVTTDADLSALVANTLVTVFSSHILEIQAERFAQSKVSLETQLKDIDNLILTYSAELEKSTSPDKQDQLETKIAQYRQIYSSLLNSYEQVRLSEAQSTSTINTVEAATPNPYPVQPNVMRNTMLAAVVGFMLALGGIVLKEVLDDRIQTPEEITRKFNLPILGVISHHKPEKEAPISITDPRSPTVEAYRKLRTNASFTNVDQPLRTIMITSAEPGEGKSTTISNLGVVMAQNGKRVIIADCDLRHPRVHMYFGLNNRHGLSSLFTQSPLLFNVARQTSVENLSVVTSGSLPPNPSELLGSQKMQGILELMGRTNDIILVDTPPVLAVTDATALAPMLDGVILVVKPGKTRGRALQHTLTQLRQVNARILGVVLNDVIVRGGAYGYHYNYYRNYSAYQKYYGPKTKAKKSEGSETRV